MGILVFYYFFTALTYKVMYARLMQGSEEWKELL